MVEEKQVRMLFIGTRRKNSERKDDIEGEILRTERK